MVDFLGTDIGLWSLGISISAIAVAVTKDFFLPYLFRPKLILESLNDDECLDNALGDTLQSRVIEGALRAKGFGMGVYPDKVKEIPAKHRVRMRWLRLRLRNVTGFFSNTAKNCYIKLIEIRNGNGQTIRPFNAFPLMWVSYESSKNNLSKGEYHLLDLAFEKEDERVLYPATWGQFDLPDALLERKAEKLGPNVYTFVVGVYGDNFDSFEKEVRVELTQKFGELKFAQ